MELCNSFVKSTLRCIYVTQMIMSKGEVWVELKCFLVLNYRFVILPHVVQSIACDHADDKREWIKLLCSCDFCKTFIEPGSPWENGYLESLHGKLRDECLNEEIFWSRGEAQVVVDWYRDVYNSERPHSSLGDLTPRQFAEQFAMSSQGQKTLLLAGSVSG